MLNMQPKRRLRDSGFGSRSPFYLSLHSPVRGEAHLQNLGLGVRKEGRIGSEMNECAIAHFEDTYNAMVIVAMKVASGRSMKQEKLDNLSVLWR